MNLAQQAATISTITKGKLRLNKIYPLENQLHPAQSHTLSDHELNSIAAGKEAEEFVPSPMFNADSDAPGLGNWGFQVGEMTAEEKKAALREIGFLFAD